MRAKLENGSVSARAPPALLLSECGQQDSLSSVIKTNYKSAGIKFFIASMWCRTKASASHRGTFFLL